MHPKVLKLSKCGMPLGWIDIETAAVIVSKGYVLWSIGSEPVTLHGGLNRMGSISTLDIPPIIATRGTKSRDNFTPILKNNILFSRDQNLCLYCGQKFDPKKLTRDHIKPRSQGGPNTWENVVSSCKRCNNKKADRTPEEAGMELLALPYAPNIFEYMALKNSKRILADQMEFLSGGFSSNFRIKPL